jgi:glycosyltransferase involved in cell wall biosynthesis
VRIALLINGMTGYLDAQFRHLHKLGHELLLVAPGSPKVAVGAMQDTKFTVLDRADEYAQVIAWPEQPDPAELTRTVLAFDPDAVYMTAWNFSKAYRAVMKSVRPEVVRLMYMDNLWRAAPRQWLGRATHRWYLRPVADAAVVASDRSEFYARRLGFGPSDVIRGGAVGDTDLFCSPPRTAEELGSRRSFLYVGRLVDHKGPDVLAAAYARYRELTDDPWDLHVVGIGPMADLLEDKPGVVMHGFVDPEAVAELMRSVSCFVLTSHIEPYGVVVHEAAACGLPILCTEFSGAAPVFVSDGVNGWQVASGDIEAWARAMLRMSRVEPSRLASMSDVSRGVAARMSPAGWALNITEEIERRIAAGGGRLSR